MRLKPRCLRISSSMLVVVVDHPIFLRILKVGVTCRFRNQGLSTLSIPFELVGTRPLLRSMLRTSLTETQDSCLIALLSTKHSFHSCTCKGNSMDSVMCYSASQKWPNVLRFWIKSSILQEINYVILYKYYVRNYKVFSITQN